MYRLACVLLAAAVACTPRAESVENSASLVGEVFYVLGDGSTVSQLTPPDEQIYKQVGTERVLVTHPDGTPMTWGQFNSARGTIRAACSDQGTVLTMEGTNLVPNGVYAAWAVVTGPPGAREGGGLAIIGGAPFGPRDGSEATFVAAADGTGSITATVPGGEPNFRGQRSGSGLPTCLLDAHEFLVIAFYRMDSQPVGDELGDSRTYALHLTWFFNYGEATVP
jgi:hypothetical protein